MRSEVKPYKFIPTLAKMEEEQYIYIYVGCSSVPLIFLVGTVPSQVLAVHFHGFNPDRSFMLSEKRITGRASYRIKAKNKPKTEKQMFSQFWGRTKNQIFSCSFSMMSSFQHSVNQ